MEELITYLLFFFVALIAGFINSMAGGGSLLTIPILIFAGLDPVIANATNRITVFFQSLSSVAGYKSKGVSAFPFALYLSLAAILGSLAGVQIAIDIKGELFNKILVVVMLIVVGMIVFKKKTDMNDLAEKLQGKHFIFSLIAFFFVGVYGGFIQAGVGFIIMFALSMINRLPLVKVNAIKSFVICIYTVIAIILFAYHGKIHWQYGFLLSIGGIIGSWLGSRWSVKKGDKAIKAVLLIMVLIMAVKLWFFE